MSKPLLNIYLITIKINEQIQNVGHTYDTYLKYLSLMLYSLNRIQNYNLNLYYPACAFISCVFRKQEKS